MRIYQHLFKRRETDCVTVTSLHIGYADLFLGCTISCCLSKKAADPMKEVGKPIHLQYNTLMSRVPHMLIVKIEFQPKTSGF